MERQNVVINIGSQFVKVLLYQIDEEGVRLITGKDFLCEGVKAGNIVDKDTFLSVVQDIAYFLKTHGANTYLCELTLSGSYLITKQTIHTANPEGHLLKKAEQQKLFKPSYLSKYTLISSLVRGLWIDKSYSIHIPKNIKCQNIKVELTDIFIQTSYLKEIIHLFKAEGIHIHEKRVHPSILSVSEAVTSLTEREKGVLVIDMGAGKTDFAIYYMTRLIKLGYIPFGGDDITNDIAYCINSDSLIAEKIKKQFGEAFSSSTSNHEIINFENDKSISKKRLSAVIQARLEEILGVVRYQLKDELELAQAVVITGGCADIANIRSLSTFLFGKPMRIGFLQSSDIEVDEEVLTLPSFTSVTGSPLLNLENSLIETIPKEKTSNGSNFVSKFFEGFVKNDD